MTISITSKGFQTRKLIPQGDDKIAQTPSHSVHFVSKQKDELVPTIQFKPRVITDPEAKTQIVSIDEKQLGNMTKASEFSSWAHECCDSVKSYLLPTKNELNKKLGGDDRTYFAYNNIVGHRIEQFCTELTSALSKSGLKDEELVSARKVVNLFGADLFRGRIVEFDNAATGTYWSFRNDAAFVHVFEAMRDALKSGSPKRKFVQNEIDAIYTHEYIPHGKIDEKDCERSLSLMAIDQATRHIVSMKDGSYELLRVPNDYKWINKGKFAYWDGEKYVFEKTGKSLSEGEIGALEHLPAKQIVFRPCQDGEKSRAGFLYDWHRNRTLGRKSTETSWGDHCDIKAVIETLLASMPNAGDIEEYRADSKTKTKFTRALQLEALASIIEFGSSYGTKSKSLSGEDFATTRPPNEQTTLLIETDKTSISFPIKLTDMPSMRHILSSKLPNKDLTSFEDNPDITHGESLNANTVDATKHTFTCTTNGFGFDSKGQLTQQEIDARYDLSLEKGSVFLIASQLVSLSDKIVNRIYFNPKTKELSEAATQFVSRDGQFEAKELQVKSLGKIAKAKISQKMPDQKAALHKFQLLEKAIKTGEKIGAEGQIASDRWSGEVHSIGMQTDWRSKDGEWERVTVMLDATFGSTHKGVYIVRRDPSGKAIDCYEHRSPAESVWSISPRVSPLIWDNDQWLLNDTMASRGIFELGEGKVASLSFLQDLYDLAYLGLSAKDNKTRYTITQEGRRFVYTDKSEWERDIKRSQKSTLVENSDDVLTL